MVLLMLRKSQLVVVLSLSESIVSLHNDFPLL